MKITKVSAKQFAGIFGKEVSFGDGVNVVYGKNEAGKSTLVSLISAILFQSTELKRRKKEDKYLNELSSKDFKNNFFPVSKKDDIQIDNIDGTLTLETASGRYELKKSWGEGAAAELTAPNKIIKSEIGINEIIHGLLGYYEGVYNEVLLSPQKNAAENLKKLLDNAGKTGEALAETVSKALSESDGISADKIMEKIDEKIEELVSNYDPETGTQKKKPGGGRWARGIGTILQALYDWEDAQKEYDDLKELDEKVDVAYREYKKAEENAEDAETELNDFNKHYADILARETNEKIIRDCGNDIERYSAELEKIPGAKAALAAAWKLDSERKNRDLLECYDTAKKLHDELCQAEAEFEKISCPDKSEIAEAQKADDDIRRLENSLCGMNISAKFKMLGGSTIKITSLVSGKEIAPENGNVCISEAVRIEIPGVMDMTLSPAEVNADDVNKKIVECSSKRQAVFAKYNVDSVDRLKLLKEEHDAWNIKKERAESRLNDVLKGEDYVELESKAAGLPDVRVKAQIDAEIAYLCGGNLDKFIGKTENEVKRFTDEYVSEENLEKLISDCREELKKAAEAAASAENIPEKYRDISGPEEYKIRLETAVKEANENKTEAYGVKSAAEYLLEKFIESHNYDLREKAESARCKFREQTELLDHWYHIKQALEEQKTALAQNPLKDLANRFTENLGEISGNVVSAEFPEAGKPDFTVSSGERTLDFVKLSDGTRDTVYLAFRLAVLDHLFPEGGGVMVLDDPLNDMDADRVKRSCELIKKSAERHQIIFLTCREEYAELLGGNEIRL